jgi:integrase
MAPPVRVTGGWSVRIRYGADQRGRFRMPDMSESEAKDRARRLESMARALADAGKIAEARVLLEDAASQRTAKSFAATEAKAAEIVAAAGAEPKQPRVKTFRDVCELWWSRELHRLAPDRVARCNDKSMALGRARLTLLCQSVGDVPLTKFSVDTAERALASLPRRLRPATRRQYAARLMVILKLAALPPLRVIERSPIPSGWAPSIGPRRAFGFIYPAEDKQLLLCSNVDIEHRWLWAFLAREGCRISEALRLKWSDIDTSQGVINLDKNKSRCPRAWRLGADVASALVDKRHSDGAGEGNRVFRVGFGPEHSASHFRADLRTAKVSRAELFASTPERSPIRAHDLRGSFVTLALALGAPEAWVMDRTGHTTSGMLNLYRRQARFASELALGWFGPMDELLGVGRSRAKRGGTGTSEAASGRRAWTPRHGGWRPRGRAPQTPSAGA